MTQHDQRCLVKLLTDIAQDIDAVTVEYICFRFELIEGIHHVEAMLGTGSAHAGNANVLAARLGCTTGRLLRRPMLKPMQFIPGSR